MTMTPHPAAIGSMPMPILYHDMEGHKGAPLVQQRSSSLLRSSFGTSSNGSPSSVSSSDHRSFRHPGSSFGMNSSSDEAAKNDRRLSIMLEANKQASSRRRLCNRSITSAPATRKEEKQAISNRQVNAQELARQKLHVQQQQALKRQQSVRMSDDKGGKTSLDAFLSAGRTDGESIHSEDDDDMFSMFQWSTTSEMKIVNSGKSVASGLSAGRSRSAPRGIRLGRSSSVTSERDIRRPRSMSTPKQVEEHMAEARQNSQESLGTLQAGALSSLYGSEKDRRTSKTKKRVSPITKPSNKSPRRKSEDDERIRSIRRSRALMQDDDEKSHHKPHKSSRKISGEEKSHKSSHRIKRDGDEKGRHRKHINGDEKSHKSKKSHKSSRHVGEEKSHRSRKSKESDGKSHRSKSSRKIRTEGNEKIHRKISLTAKEGDRHKSSRRLREASEPSVRSKSKRRSVEGDEVRRHRSKRSEDKEKMRRSKSELRRSSDSQVFSKSSISQTFYEEVKVARENPKRSKSVSIPRGSAIRSCEHSSRSPKETKASQRPSWFPNLHLSSET